MWITRDVDLPDEILEAQAEGRLVFFVGAGASVDQPSNLPLFGALAQTLAGLARVPFDKRVAIDYFLGSLPKEFDTHRHARDIIATSGSRPNTTHAALMRLASAAGPLRVVTTNFDDHLASVATRDGIEFADKWVGPALPLGDDFVGLVHLHGSVDRDPRELVLTDKDFGRAYLTAAWATRFLLPMFQKFTVVFIGYSHDDPIMRYLALGLPSGTPRFVLTSAESALDLKWERLGVQPVPYPAVGGDHGALVKALEAWADRVRMGRIEHSARIQEIVAAGAVLTPVDRDYLIERLGKIDGARDFASATAALSPELKIDWLRWLESFEGFRQLFDSREVSEPSTALGAWFCRTFIANVELHGAALQTVQRLGQTFARPLFTAASFAIEDLARAEPAAGRRWGALLATSIHGCTAPARSDVLLPFAPAVEPSSISVLRLALRPFLSLRRPWSVDGSEDSISVPGADVGWNGDEYSLTSHLVAAVQTAPPGDHSLGLALEEALTTAYDLLEAYHGEPAWDRLSFGRSAIEPHQQDEIREPIDAIVDALRDFGVRARAAQLNLAENWWRSGRPLLQRIALHLIATDSDLDANSKLGWLLDRSSLYEDGLKHETYAVLGAATVDASNEIRSRLLEVVCRGPNYSSEVPDRDRHIEYGKYNLLVWLTNHAPKWKEAAAALDSVQHANPDFAPREHPDFDRWMSTGSWGGVLPMDPSEFAADVRHDARVALAGLLSRDFSERAFDEPSWGDALSLVTQTVANDPSTGEALWKAALAQDTDERQLPDITRAIVAGWTNADLGASALLAIDRTRELVPDVESANQIGRFLLEQIRKRVDDSEDEFLGNMRDLAQALWVEQGSTFSHREGMDVMSMAPLYLNSWPGSLTLYWLTEVDRRWRQNRDEWAGLNEVERTSILQLLGGPPHALDATRAALASQLFFLFAADSAFVSTFLLPLFNDPESAALVWNAYLHHPRYDDRLLAAGLLDAMVAEWDRLDDVGEEMIQEQFFSVVASVISFAGITDTERQSLLDRSVLSSDGAYAGRFAGATIRLLRADQVDGAAVWERWLGSHVRRRLAGIPRSATTEELARWADAPPYVGAAIPAATSVFGQTPPGFGDWFIVPDFPEGTLATHGQELIEFFVARLRNTVPGGYGIAYRVQTLTGAIRSKLGATAVEPLLTAARDKGLLDPGAL
ncbi:SIR2 family protein [Microbacterium azadirachtae]|uniref:SIR2 family protein n=1 Tax=Microbacterium azadirachtae TaxID=582680 RepID=UPI0008844560|nr:SIR2 family protein [Microbacterium azadirachtae]SDL90466.1 SIR2-like domain-containing protein [Microbacterium azadirachtae]SEG17187.1 SIR2-like domain-containing protein [Microbacterium azadirachtae]SEG19730.1 SIR2-like domain-containing protein [Microbacterium azadirachtae]